MSTRATYGFDDGIVYKHHDGYPSGAADHLRDIYNAAQFLAKTPKSEQTESRDIHGDTEYHYDVYLRSRHRPRFVSRYRIMVSERNANAMGDWRQVLDCDLERFTRDVVCHGAFETLRQIVELENRLETLKEEK